jgi:hypothetical protein
MKKSLSVAALLFLFAAALGLPGSLFAQQVINGNRYFVAGTGIAYEVPNALSGGTTLHALAKLTGSPSSAVITSTTDTSGIYGVVIDQVGTPVNAVIATAGGAYLLFDGSTTSGDYVQQSTSVGGDGHDAGSTCPTSGQVLGRVLSTNSGAGLYLILVGQQGCGTGSGGSGIPYPAAGVAVSNGSAWLTPYQVGTSANNLVQLNGTGQLPALSAANLFGFPTLNQNTTGVAAGLSGCPSPSSVAAGSFCYSNGTSWTILPGNTSGTPLWLQELSGVPSYTTPPGGGNVTAVGTPSAGQIAEWTSSTTIQGLTLLGVTMGGTGTGTAPTSAQVPVGNSGGTAYAPQSLTQDISMTNAGVVTVIGLQTKALPALSAFSSAPYLTYNSGTNLWAAANPFASPTFTGTLTFPITGATQCLQVNSSGTLAGTGSPCGSGGGGGNVNGPGTSTSGDIALFNNTSGTLLSDAGFGFPLANAHLANSTIGIAGTPNEISSSTTSPALGGSTTLALTNPLIFPGKWTGAAGTTSAATFNIPSGVAPSSGGSGDFWNLSGILQFFDGSHTNSLTTIQSAPTSGHFPLFSGTAGLLIDSGNALPNGTTATTQPCSDTSSLLATDDYVQCFANAAANGSILAKLYVNPIRGGYVADASTTSGSSTVTCPNLDCNFVAGNVGDLVWVQTNLTNLVTATYICPQSTIATVNSANSITLTTSADCTSTTTGTATLVWGPDDSGTYGSNSDALDAAFTATGANGALCGSLALSAGIYLIQHAEFNYLPSGCSAISSYQAPTIFGVNSTATQIIPTPNFSFTGGSHGGCGSIGTSSCLFGAQYQYVQGLKIFGMGAGTGTHNVSLTQNYGTIFYDVVLDGWCANCAGSVGYYQQFSQSEGLVGGSVFFGATNCQDVGVLNKLDNWPCYGGVNTGLLVSAGSTISQENYFGGNTYEIVVDAGATLFSNVDTDFNFPPNSYEILNEGTINFNGFQRANSTANPIFGFSGTAVTTFQNSKLYGPTSGSWKNAFYAGILGSTMLDQGGNTWNGAQAVPYIATLTNSSDNVSCGSGTTCAKAFVSNTAANSVLLAGCESYTGTVTTPTDTLSLTWISLGNVATGSTYAASISTAMYYAENTAGGADTVTCHYSSSSGGAVEIAEIDNAYIASPIDSGNTTSSGSGTAISSHAPTTTFNSDDSFLVVMRNGTPSFTSGTCTPASNCIVIPGWFGGTSAQNGVGIAPISPVMTGTLSVNADWVAYWFNIRPYGVAPAIFGNAQAAASVGGTAQAQTITLSQPPPGLYPNLAITYLPTNSNNAAAPTIAVNGFTATPVTKCGTTALIAGDIAANVFASVLYDGVEFQLGNPQAAGCGLGSGTQTIASGTAALGTSAIASGACASVVTVSATGVLITDVVTVGANQNISGITGYVPSTSGTLTIWPPWPTANNVNILVCNQTSSSVTPGAVTLNYRVVR